jgi:hypothetical protein
VEVEKIVVGLKNEYYFRDIPLCGCLTPLETRLIIVRGTFNPSQGTFSI